ncbi:MAG: hypothetical protein U0941_07460 [Planctomycetaceae bacterium]
MSHIKLVANLVVIVVATTNMILADDQSLVPPGAIARLEPLHTIAGDRMVSLALFADGKSILWKNRDYTLHHWNLSTATEVGQFCGDDWWSQDIPQHFSIFQLQDQHSLLHSAAHGLTMLDLRTGQERVVSELARGKSSWISADGKRIVTYAKQGSWSKRTATATFTLWDLQRSEKIREFTHSFQDAPEKAGAGAQLAAVSIAPNGKTIATSWIYVGHGPMLTYRVGQVVCLWDVASGQKRQLDAAAAFHLHFLDMGQTLVCADGRNAGGARSGEDRNHGLMEIWDVTAGHKLHKFESSVDWGGPIAFSPDGKSFASSGGLDDNAVYIWSTATGQQVQKFAGNPGGILCLTFSHDGSLLASGSQDSILIWETGALE